MDNVTASRLRYPDAYAARKEKFPISVTLNAAHSSEEVSQLLKWLTTNFGPRCVRADPMGSVSETIDDESRWVYFSEYEFMFKREEDAILFSLTWL